MINQYCAHGRVCSDIKFKHNSDACISTGVLSVKRNFKNDDKYEFDNIPFRAVGKTAKFLYENAKKGDFITISGRLFMSPYTHVHISDVDIDQKKRKDD